MKRRIFLSVIAITLLAGILSGCWDQGGTECPGEKDYKLTYENGTVEYVAAWTCYMEAGSVICRKCGPCLPFASYNNVEKMELCQSR